MEGQEVVVETRLGRVPLHGRWSDGARPLIVVVAGAFDNWRTHAGLPARLQGADVALVSIPGFGDSPYLRDMSVSTYAAAVGEAMGLAFPGRPYAAVGVSLGALVAMSLPARRILAVEPFASIADQPEFIAWCRAKYATEPSGPLTRFLTGVFGIGPDTLEPRDYSAALDAVTAPTVVLAAEAGFLDPASRARLATKPNVSLRIIPEATHNIVGTAPDAFYAAVDELLALENREHEAVPADEA